MPWLVALLASLAGEIIKFFMRFFTKKVAIALGFTAAFITTFTIFILCLETIITGLSYVVPDGFSVACSWFIPDNFTLCLSAMMTAKIARFTWELTMHKMDLFFFGGLS